MDASVDSEHDRSVTLAGVVPVRPAIILAVITVAAALLAAQQFRAPPAIDSLEIQIAAAYRYIDHMALNLARNSLRRTSALSGRVEAVREAESLIAALDVMRRSADGGALEEIAVHRGDEVSVQIALGRLAVIQGNAHVARVHFERAVERAPENAAARLELGKALFDLGRDAEAMRQLALAHERRGKFDYIAWEYALARLKQGHIDEALPVLRQLVDDNPGNLGFALQYLQAAAGQPCSPVVQRILETTTAYFGNDFTMRLGDNDEPWQMVVDRTRIRLVDRDAKRAMLAHVRREFDEASCED